MPTPEEIKKIEAEYAELHRISESEAYYENKQNIETEAVLPILQWLSKDYCIVPKTLLKELYDCYKQHESVSKEKGLYESEMIARGSQATMRDIFGKSLFEE